MKQLLFGTTNQAKLAEVRGVLQADGIEVLGLRDIPDIQQVEETGEDFEENAVLKAKGYFSQTNIPTIADDGGIMVDALGGLPGVHSKRWLGHDASDKELAEAVLEKMRGVPQEKRTARLGGIMVFWDGEHLIKKEHWTEGYIADRLMTEIQPGFPYRAILMIPEFAKAYGALTDEEHEQVNFRRKNLAALKPEILRYLKENTL